jgi:hypothetical protein
MHHQISSTSNIFVTSNDSPADGIYVDTCAWQMNGSWDKKLRLAGCARLGYFWLGAAGWILGGRSAVQHPRRISNISGALLLNV